MDKPVEQGNNRWFCICLASKLEEEITLVARAETQVEASYHIHKEYTVDYIIDIMTPKENEQRKMALRRSMLPGSLASMV